MAGIEVEFSSKPPGEWFEFVDNACYHSVYNTKQWFFVLADSFDYYKPHYAVARRDGEIVAGLPLFDVSKYGVHKVLSLPLSYGGPVALPKESEAVEAVLHAFAENLNFKACYKALYLPFHSPFERESAKVLQKHGFSRDRLVKYVLDASGKSEEQVWMQCVGRKERNSIRKAEKSGVQVRELDSKDFHSVWNLLVSTAARLGVKPDKQLFIRNAFEVMTSAGLSKWFGAFHGGKMIAVTSFFYYKNTAVYFANASDKNYWHLPANSILLWTAIKKALEGGHEIMDLGTGDTERYPTLSKFKESFGAKPVESSSYFKTTKAYELAAKARNILSSMRLP